MHLRLKQLIAEKYIYRNKFPNPNQKHVYSIGNQGVKHLAYFGAIPFSNIPTRLRTNELKPLFLNHTLLVTDIHAAFILGGRNSEKRLANWREGKQLYESVSFYEDGKKKRLPVCPDAFFEIEQSGKRLAYALEADRGTTTRRTFNDKIHAYWRFLEQNRQQQTYSVKWFRVVTVTLTEARANNLADFAKELVPTSIQKYFLFTYKDRLSFDQSKAIVGAIFRTPHGHYTTSL